VPSSIRGVVEDKERSESVEAIEGSVDESKEPFNIAEDGGEDEEGIGGEDEGTDSDSSTDDSSTIGELFSLRLVLSVTFAVFVLLFDENFAGAQDREDPESVLGEDDSLGESLMGLAGFASLSSSSSNVNPTAADHDAGVTPSGAVCLHKTHD